MLKNINCQANKELIILYYIIAEGKIGEMKRSIVIFTLILFVIITPMPARSMSIDLLSSSVHTWGSDREHNPECNFSWDEYDTTVVSATMPSNNVVGYAIAKINESTAIIESFAYARSIGARSSAEIVFQTIGASYINIFIEGEDTGMADGRLRLTDMTTSEELLYFTSIGRIAYNYQGLFTIDPSHIYRLETYAYGDADRGNVKATMSLGVPEPTTMLLLGLGLLGLAGVRRKIKK